MAEEYPDWFRSVMLSEVIVELHDALEAAKQLDVVDEVTRARIGRVVQRFEDMRRAVYG